MVDPLKFLVEMDEKECYSFSSGKKKKRKKKEKT
jgi:hypothetical protein